MTGKNCRYTATIEPATGTTAMLNTNQSLFAAALLIAPVIAGAQTATAAKPANAPTIEQLDVLNVRAMNEGEKGVACVAALRIVAGATTNAEFGQELGATANKFRDHAMQNGIDQTKGEALMQKIAKTFEGITDKAKAGQSIEFYAINCMRSAHAMGMTTLDITKPRPAAAPANAKAPATTKAPAPKKP